VRLADADAPPHALVRQEDSRVRAAYTADDTVIAAGSLELLIETLLEEELETGRDLAIDELFDDEAHGFNLNGISLGTLAAPMPQRLVGLMPPQFLRQPRVRDHLAPVDARLPRHVQRQVIEVLGGKHCPIQRRKSRVGSADAVPFHKLHSGAIRTAFVWL
jgi:hypothetical protein